VVAIEGSVSNSDCSGGGLEVCCVVPSLVELACEVVIVADSVVEVDSIVVDSIAAGGSFCPEQLELHFMHGGGGDTAHGWLHTL